MDQECNINCIGDDSCRNLYIYTPDGDDRNVNLTCAGVGACDSMPPVDTGDRPDWYYIFPTGKPTPCMYYIYYVMSCLKYI